MCISCGGTCGSSARSARKPFTLDVKMGGRALRIRDAGGPAPLYVARALDPDCAAALSAWVKASGLAEPVAPDAMHVTVAYSRASVDWFRFASWWSSDEIVIPAGGPRRVEAFKDDAIVLRFASDSLESRWNEFRAGGCSWDHPGYAPHVTVARGVGRADLGRLKAYSGSLRFGPEEFGPVT